MSNIVTGSNLPEDLKAVLEKYGVPMDRTLAFTLCCYGVDTPLYITTTCYVVEPPEKVTPQHVIGGPKTEQRKFKLLAIE